MEFAEMKKILILTLVAVATLWAEIQIEMIVRIDFQKEMFSYDSIDEESEECAKFFEKHVSTTPSGNTCGSGGLCKTALDSNILFGWSYYYFSEQSAEYYVLTGATHTLRDAIEEDFLHYKNCKGFIGDDSVFNSIFTRIDSILVPAINDSLQKNEYSTRHFIFDYTSGEMLGLIVPGPSFEFSDYALDTVKARNAAISSIVPAKYKLETIRVQNRRLTASPKLLGREFTLFDVNGHELRCGTLQNNMQLPAYPTVIKIQGFGTRLLK